jgi:hypothetical protein
VVVNFNSMQVPTYGYTAYVLASVVFVVKVLVVAAEHNVASHTWHKSLSTPSYD